MRHHTTDPNRRVVDIADHNQDVRDANPVYDQQLGSYRRGDWPGDWLKDYKQIQIEFTMGATQ